MTRTRRIVFHFGAVRNRQLVGQRIGDDEGGKRSEWCKNQSVS